MKNWTPPIENFLTALVSMFAASIYFSKTGLSVFGIAAILVMLLWRFIPGYSPMKSVPKSVVILFILFLVDFLVSALMSEYSRWVVSDLGKYRHLLFGGLLYAAPLSNRNRRVCLVVLLISASLDGLTGLLQYFDIHYGKSDMVFWTRAYSRPLGNSSDQILYAANLALAFGAAIVMLFIDWDAFKSKRGKVLLITSAVVMLMGILVSGSRGVWVALVPACLIALYCHSRRNALIFLSMFLMAMLLVFAFSTNITQRASTIVTSLYTENEAGSTGNRIELWKGALLMFKQSPIVGVGAGDFQAHVKQFIAEKKLKEEIVASGHAHSIYFQVLATRGLIGFAIFIAFFVSLVLWGRNEMRDGNEVGGQIILMSTLLALFGGLTENYIEVHRYLAAFGFTIGLMGPYGVKDRNSTLA
jgi:O-antigen ligase